MDLLHRTFSLSRPVFKIILCLIFALFISIEMNREVYAQSQEDITITAQTGLNGFCKTDKWMPVHITVENKGADINARVQTSFINSASGETVNGMDISLPATSRKDFFLYVMPDGLMRTFAVSVLDGNKVLAKTDLRVSCLGDPTIIFGLLTDNPSAYNPLNDVRPLTGVTKTAQLTISDLPDLAQGWAMLDAIIISNVDTGTLSAKQKQALELWVANGGKLFVTGGIQWQNTTAGLGDFLPIKLTSTKNVEGLPALTSYIINSTPLDAEVILATGKIKADGNVLVEQNGIPLLIEKQIGYGKVYFFAADPGLQPLSDWPGMEDLYEHLLAYPSAKPSWASGPWDTYNSSTALATLPELSLPSFIYICGWLGLYIIVIGPVNYFVLRRIKRTELAWVTVPVLVIIFTSMAYFSGYLYRGTRPIMNRIMLAQAWQGVDQAQTTAIIGLYSPVRTAYNVESDDQFLIFPFPDMSENLQGSNSWLSLKNDKGYTLPNVRVEIGGMQSLGMEGTLQSIPIKHDLILSITNKTPVLTGNITNESNYTLRDAVIVTANGWKVIGDLEPHKSRSIKVTLANNSDSTTTSQYSVVSDLGMDMYSEDIVEKRRVSFFQAITTSTYNIVSPNSGTYLMAWVDNEIKAPAGLEGKTLNTTDTLLYFEKLTPTLETTGETLMLTSSIYSWESSLGDSLTTPNYNIPSGGYRVHFQPSLPIRFSSVTSLDLQIGSSTVPNKLEVSLWNYQTKTWEVVTLLSYSTKVPEAEKYVGMDGEILMKITGSPNDYFDITSVDFILKVQP